MMMKLHAVWVVALIGCGSEEMFGVELEPNQHPIDADASVTLRTEMSTFGLVTAVGDLDGDGLTDIFVRPFMLPNGFGDDRIYIVYGGQELGPDIDLDFDQLPQIINVGAFGIIDSTVPLGDIDGDGLADVTFASGVEYLLYGSRIRISGQVNAADVAVQFTTSSGGLAVGSLGDIDGDGLADIAMIFESVGGPTPPPSVAHVFYGRAERFAGSVDIATADAHLELPVLPRTWRASMVGIGDIDGDGCSDMVVRVDGDADNDQPHPVDERIIMGSRTRLPVTATSNSVAATQIVGDGLAVEVVGTFASGTTSAVATPLGDLDGDGFADFALFDSVPFGQHIFYGRAHGFGAQLDVGSADAVLVATNDVLNPVTQVATADVTGDGVADIVSSDAGFLDGDGAIFVLPGTGARLTGVVDPSQAPVVYIGSRQRLVGCAEAMDVYYPDCIGHEHIGTILGLGDVRGDGRPAIITPAPWYNFADTASDGRYGFLSRAYVVPYPR